MSKENYFETPSIEPCTSHLLDCENKANKTHRGIVSRCISINIVRWWWNDFCNKSENFHGLAKLLHFRSLSFMSQMKIVFLFAPLLFLNPDATLAWAKVFSMSKGAFFSLSCVLYLKWRKFLFFFCLCGDFDAARGRLKFVCTLFTPTSSNCVVDKKNQWFWLTITQILTNIRQQANCCAKFDLLSKFLFLKCQNWCFLICLV